MNISVFKSKNELAQAAADNAAELIRRAIADRGQAYIIAATGASQFEFLEALVHQDLDWKQTTFFHLDEYVGLPASHPASFRRYLQERIANVVNPGAFHFINGEAENLAEECGRIRKLISQQTIDVAFVGVGENGHLAFNDPPADFATTEPYLVVNLDEVCRRQQVGEGWFTNLDEVPRQAISMSIQQILKAQEVICVVPDRRKALAIRDCLELEVSPGRPASILQQHPRVTVYLDCESASLLTAPR
ncbi:MAG TPA: glucosamine-6-phosphate deaminase [Pyrinomonadaceae bacterium]|nr:glucosamine-6-phosphate deaminase [Pyrinomonadaceae bacterium]